MRNPSTLRVALRKTVVGSCLAIASCATYEEQPGGGRGGSVGEDAGTAGSSSAGRGGKAGSGGSPAPGGSNGGQKANSGGSATTDGGAGGDPSNEAGGSGGSGGAGKAGAAGMNAGGSAGKAGMGSGGSGGSGGNGGAQNPVSAIYLEAEMGALSGSPMYSISSLASASNGKYIEPNGAASCNKNATGPNRAQFVVNLSSGTYALWMRVDALGSPDGDSAYYRFVELDPTWTVWNSNFPSGWAWKNTASFGVLSTGTYTLELASRECGFRIDKIYLTKNGDTPVNPP